MNDGPAFYVLIVTLIDISCMGISCQASICTEVAPGRKCFETASARSSDCRMVQTICIWLARFTGLWLPKRARSGYDKELPKSKIYSSRSSQSNSSQNRQFEPAHAILLGTVCLIWRRSVQRPQFVSLLDLCNVGDLRQSFVVEWYRRSLNILSEMGCDRVVGNLRSHGKLDY